MICDLLALPLSCGCPIPEGVQSQVGWGFEQPHLVEDISAHDWEIGTK